MSYIGRFAPSPSGDLHFGSLVTAVGSYLQAKAKQGKWLVRIEDIDPPREVKGASAQILHTLEHFGLYWDDTVLYQSQCSERYKAALERLLSQNKAYFCDCTRHRIQSLSGFYDSCCQKKGLTEQSSLKPLAIRLRQSTPVYHFCDQLRGQQHIHASIAEEDFTLRRRDNLFAYNLAVVLDDHFQGITEIVRGADLLIPTSRQLSLYQQFDWQAPTYLHLPLALDLDGNKLSKQNHAQPIATQPIIPTLALVLQFLNQHLPQDLLDYNREQLLNWAILNWDPTRIPKHDIIYKQNTLTIPY